MAFLLLISWLITLSSIQSWLVMRARWAMSYLFQTPVEISRVDVGLPSHAILEGMVVLDQQQDTLACIDALRVSVINFTIWDYLFDPTSVDQLCVHHIGLERPQIKLYKQQHNAQWNFQFLLDAFASSDDTASTSKPLGITLEGIDLIDASVQFVDSTKITRPKRPGRMDYAHLAISDIYGDLSLNWQGDSSLEVEVEGLRAKDQVSGFTLDRLDLALSHQFQTAHRAPNLSIDYLHVITPQSNLTLQAQFPNQTLANIISASDSIYTRVKIAPASRVGVQDLTYFSGPLPLAGVFGVDGLFSITAKRIRGSNVHVNYLDQTRILSNFELRNPLVADSLILSAQLIQSTLATGELRQMLPDQGLPTSLDRVRLVKVDGNFNGHPEDFRIDMETETEIGYLRADMHMILPPRAPDFTYDGQLTTRGLNLDALGISDTPLSNSFTFNGHVKGQGIDWASLQAEVNASIVRSSLGGYYLDTLSTDLQISNQQIAGTIQGSDGVGYANLAVDWDQAHQPGHLGLEGEVQQIDLQTYGLVDTQILSSGKLMLDLTGDSLEALTGKIELSAFQLDRPRDSLHIEVPKLFLDISGTSYRSRYINLKSSLVDLDFAGDFTYRGLLNLASRLQEEANLFLENNDSLITAYYTTPQADSNSLNFAVGLACKDSLNRLLSFLGVPLDIADGTTLTARFAHVPDVRNGMRSELRLDLKGDSLKYASVFLHDLALTGNLIKFTNKNNFFLTTDFLTQEVGFGRTLAFEEVNFYIEEAGNKYGAELAFYQPGSDGRGHFHAETKFLPGGSIETTLLSEDSYLDIHGDSLLIRPNNVIIFSGSEIDIYNLLLQDPTPNDQPRYYRLDGLISEDPEASLNFLSSGFDLQTITDFYPVEQNLEGIFSVDISLQSLYERPEVVFSARLDNFVLDGYSYGTILAKGTYMDSLEQVSLNSYLYQPDEASETYRADTILTLSGLVNLGEPQEALDLHLHTPLGIPLAFMEPFVAGELEQFQGRVRLASFNVTGPLNEPRIDGTGYFDGSSFVVDYFKTRYTFTGELLFDNERVLLEKVEVEDLNHNKAQLFGSIRHRGLQDFTFNLQLSSAPNFLVMNTARRDNDSFYGTVRLNQALASVNGNLNELKVQAISSFAPGSKLVLPVSDVSEFQKPAFIVFSDEDQTDPQLDRVQANLSGVNMSLTALTGEDLEVELIFDERIGDRIRARGNGAITLDIDPEGNFTMQGDYEISQGEYLFTSEYLINKLFKVQPGSKISWNGDPYQAEINIEAYYPLYADINQLYPSESNTGSNRTLVHVVMRLRGELLKPDVELAIRLPNINQQSVDQLASLLQSIQDDEQQLNNQIFSLILFNRFVPIGTGGLGDNTAGTAISTGLSELFSSRLNYWISQATNDRLNVGVNAASTQEVNLLLSAKLFNDRVKIERDGILFNNQAETILSTQDIIGNVSLEIRLNDPDGSNPNQQKPELVFAVFNRESLQIDGGVQNIYQTGAGLIYKRDFDHISDILKKKQEAQPSDSTQTQDRTTPEDP